MIRQIRVVAYEWWWRLVLRRFGVPHRFSIAWYVRQMQLAERSQKTIHLPPIDPKKKTGWRNYAHTFTGN